MNKVDIEYKDESNRQKGSRVLGGFLWFLDPNLFDSLMEVWINETLTTNN